MAAPKPLSETPLAVGVVSADRRLFSRIQKILEESGWSIAFSASPADVERKGESLAADVVVVCGSIGDEDGSPVGLARRVWPEVPVVACVPTEDGRPIRRVVESGVDGIVWDSRLEETLAATVHAVRVGQLVVPQDARARLQPPNLTNREKQTLSLVLMGLTNREIADKLFVSESTVKSHLNTAYRKLGVHSRAEAVRRIADPTEGFGTGILAITGPGLARGRSQRE